MRKILMLLIVSILVSSAYAEDLCSYQQPQAVNDGPYTTKQNTTINVSSSEGIFNNDLNYGPNRLSIPLGGVLDLPKFGSLNLTSDGGFTYNPSTDYFGSDSFSYIVNDGCQNSNNIAIVEIFVKKVNEFPVTTITGANPVYIDVGGNLPEGLGATSIDNEDGDISSSIVVDSFVNNLIPGKYIITYTAMDSYKSIGVAIRTVYVGAVKEDTEALCKDTIDNNFNGTSDASESSCASFYYTGPTIDILGNNPITLYIGDLYNEEGVLATDDEDGTYATTSLTIVNNIATTSGSYYVNYSVQDSRGLFAYATRTVVVATSSETTSIKCGDKLDNDGDGKLDLEDSDCSAFAPVVAPVVSGGGGGGGGGGYVPAVQPAPVSTSTLNFATTSATTSKAVGQVLGASTICKNYISSGSSILARNNKNNYDNLILLKKFLNSHLNLNIELNEFYGPQTEKAVKSFQLKYKNDILKPSGFKNPTGIVGKATIAKINKLVCTGM